MIKKYTLTDFEQLPKSDMINFASICIDKIKIEFGDNIEIKLIQIVEFSNVVHITVLHNDFFVSTLNFNVSSVMSNFVDNKLNVTYMFKFKSIDNE